MKYSIILLTILFLGTSELLAQSDFRDGYIVKKNNDTIYGLIDYRSSTSNAKKCVFRSNMNSKNQIFSPDEIKAYRFTESKYYISKSITYGNEENELFLEYIINGIVDIYYYQDELGHYWVDNGDGNLLELKNEEKEVIIDDKTYIRESKEYLGLLKAVFEESPTISKQVDNISLNHKSLIKITHAFHNQVCLTGEECIIYERKPSKLKVKFGVLAGINAMSISNTDDFGLTLYYFRDSQFKTAFFPSIGLFLKSSTPFFNQRLYIQYEGTYSQMKFESIYPTHDPVYNWTYTNTLVFTRNVLGNMLLLKYEFPQGKIRPTFQIGGFANYVIKTDYKRNVVIVNSSGGLQDSFEVSKNPFKKLNSGITMGLGFAVNAFKEKELFFEFNYQKGSGLLPKLNGLNTNMYSLSIGFPIGN